MVQRRFDLHIQHWFDVISTSGCDVVSTLNRRNFAGWVYICLTFLIKRYNSSSDRPHLISPLQCSICLHVVLFLGHKTNSVSHYLYDFLANDLLKSHINNGTLKVSVPFHFTWYKFSFISSKGRE